MVVVVVVVVVVRVVVVVVVIVIVGVIAMQSTILIRLDAMIVRMQRQARHRTSSLVSKDTIPCHKLGTSFIQRWAAKAGMSGSFTHNRI